MPHRSRWSASSRPGELPRFRRLDHLDGELPGGEVVRGRPGEVTVLATASRRRSQPTALLYFCCVRRSAWSSYDLAESRELPQAKSSRENLSESSKGFRV